MANSLYIVFGKVEARVCESDKSPFEIDRLRIHFSFFLRPLRRRRLPSSSMGFASYANCSTNVAPANAINSSHNFKWRSNELMEMMEAK